MGISCSQLLTTHEDTYLFIVVEPAEDTPKERASVPHSLSLYKDRDTFEMLGLRPVFYIAR